MRPRKKAVERNTGFLLALISNAQVITEVTSLTTDTIAEVIKGSNGDFVYNYDTCVPQLRTNGIFDSGSYYVVDGFLTVTINGQEILTKKFLYKKNKKNSMIFTNLQIVGIE